MDEETKVESTEEVKGKEPNSSTLGEMGNQLAYGIEGAGGALHKEFELKPWRMKEEKELGILKEANKEANLAQYVTMVLATMLTKCGPHDFANMKFEAKRLHLSQMLSGDVFTIYCYLRWKALSETIDMSTACPNCAHKFPFSADIKTLKVYTAEKMEDLLWEYELINPFTLKGKMVTGFKLGPVRWNTMETVTNDGANMGQAKAGVIAGCIKGFLGEDTPVAVSPSELDEMTKADIEKIAAKLDSKPLGPQMAVELDCPRCHLGLMQSIKWNYEDFFSISSR